MNQSHGEGGEFVWQKPGESDADFDKRWDAWLSQQAAIETRKKALMRPAAKVEQRKV